MKRTTMRTRLINATGVGQNMPSDVEWAKQAQAHIVCGDMAELFVFDSIA